MEILETVCAIVNTMLCCTLLQEDKIAEECVECIKIDDKIKDKDSSDQHTQHSHNNNIIIKPCTCQMCLQKLNSESKKSLQEIITTNNSTFYNILQHLHHIKQQQQQQQQQLNLSNKELQPTIVINNCSNFLLKFDDQNQKHKTSSGIDIQDPSNVTSSTKSTNLESNCSTGKSTSTTSTIYMPYSRQMNKTNKNTTCPLTSTKITEKRGKIKLRKRIADIFCRCFK